MKNHICRSIILAFTLAFAAAPASRADQPGMHQARTLANQALDLLKNDTVPDKGGHRSVAIKLLQQAVVEINAGIEYARVKNATAEDKRRH